MENEIKVGATISIQDLLAYLKDKTFKIYNGTYNGVKFFVVKTTELKFRFVSSYKFKSTLDADALEKAVTNFFNQGVLSLDNLVDADGIVVHVVSPEKK